MNKSKKAKQLRETSRQEAFKGFAYLHPNSLNEAVAAAFLRKASKFPLTQEEITNYMSKQEVESESNLES